MAMIREVKKRDGRAVPFDQTKIADAIFAAARAVGGKDRRLAEELAALVCVWLERHWIGRVPGIEDIQDTVEKVLVETGHAKTAKAYMLYRQKRSEVRERMRVRRETSTGADATDIHLQVDPGSRAEYHGWDRTRIAAALVREAGLPAGEA